METPMLEGSNTDLPISKSVVIVAGTILYVRSPSTNREPNVCQILEVFADALSVKIIALIVYRISFHPLSKYPGPFLSKITNWYSVYHAWKGDRHLDFFELHETYGKSVS